GADHGLGVADGLVGVVRVAAADRDQAAAGAQQAVPQAHRLVVAAGPGAVPHLDGVHLRGVEVPATALVAAALRVVGDGDAAGTAHPVDEAVQLAVARAVAEVDPHSWAE